MLSARSEWPSPSKSASDRLWGTAGQARRDTRRECAPAEVRQARDRGCARVGGQEVGTAIPGGVVGDHHLWAAADRPRGRGGEGAITQIEEHADQGLVVAGHREVEIAVRVEIGEGEALRVCAGGVRERGSERAAAEPAQNVELAGVPERAHEVHMAVAVQVASGEVEGSARDVDPDAALLIVERLVHQEHDGVSVAQGGREVRPQITIEVRHNGGACGNVHPVRTRDVEPKTIRPCRVPRELESWRRLSSCRACCPCGRGVCHEQCERRDDQFAPHASLFCAIRRAGGRSRVTIPL